LHPFRFYPTHHCHRYRKDETWLWEDENKIEKLLLWRRSEWEEKRKSNKRSWMKNKLKGHHKLYEKMTASCHKSSLLVSFALERCLFCVKKLRWAFNVNRIFHQHNKFLWIVRIILEWLLINLSGLKLELTWYSSHLDIPWLCHSSISFDFSFNYLLFFGDLTYDSRLNENEEDKIIEKHNILQMSLLTFQFIFWPACFQ
jgi:hypothetical protein